MRRGRVVRVGVREVVRGSLYNVIDFTFPVVVPC